MTDQTPAPFPGGFTIGNVAISSRTVLAPLAGITNLPFRLLVKHLGCGLVCSEMVSAAGLMFDNGKTRTMLESHPDEEPLSLQAFGSDPQILADACKAIADTGVAILDLNMGCSVRKVLKSGSGSALMKDAVHAARIFTAIRKAVSIPFTIKIRTGWDRTGDQAETIARIAEDCGVDAVALHPRTATQGFGGTADWSQIRRIKETVRIPVIGNGDVRLPEDGLRMMEETGCDAVMVGRAALHAPHIFRDMDALFNGKGRIPFDLPGHFALMVRYLEDTVSVYGELPACRMMRSRLGWFVKGLPGSTHFRNAIKDIESEVQARDLIFRFRDSVFAHMEARPDKTPTGYPS